MRIKIPIKKIEKVDGDAIRHNINNPLGIISMACQIMKKHKRDDLFETIDENIKRITKYVNNI